jgi:hypothetical protein
VLGQGACHTQVLVLRVMSMGEIVAPSGETVTEVCCRHGISRETYSCAFGCPTQVCGGVLAPLLVPSGQVVFDRRPA